MKNKRAFAIILFFCLQSSCFFATTITSVVCGNWSAAATWNLNRTPQATDTIVVNTFVSFDIDFTSASPGMLNVTVCGTLCGLHSYTGHFLFNGTVFMNNLTADYGNSISNSSVNIQQSASVINVGTSYDVDAGSVCVGCISACQNCSTSSKEIGTTCSDAGIAAITGDSNTYVIYPNPVSNVLHMQGISSKTNITVYDVLDNLLISTKAETDITLDVSGLADGMYSLVLVSKADKSVSKIVITR